VYDGVMRPEAAPNPPLSKADSATIAVRGELDGKLAVNYPGWEDVKVIFPRETLELRCKHGQVWARRTGKPKPASGT
jgi:hypothetical protein